MNRQSGLLHSKVIAKHHQLGVAGIWAALTLVPVMGFTFLAVEGTRYVQESSRLKDSAEAAALAVTIQDNGIDDADVMTEGYVQAYVRDIASDTVTSTRTYDDEEGYVQYDVTATTTHNSWFASNFIPSFNNTQTLVSESTAKKYFTYADKNIDVVFVADFSGSMNWEWGKYTDNDCSKNLSCKIDTLKDAIATVSESILCNDVSSDGLTCNDSDADEVADKLSNRIGIVPFNIRTREQCTDSSYCSSGSVYSVSQLNYKSASIFSGYTYQDADWDYWRTYNIDDIYDCSVSQLDCPENLSTLMGQAGVIVNVLDINYSLVDTDTWTYESTTQYDDDDNSTQTSSSCSYYYDNDGDVRCYIYKVVTSYESSFSHQEKKKKEYYNIYDVTKTQTTYLYDGFPYPDQYDYVDFDTTVSDMFNTKFTSDFSTYYRISDVDLYLGFGDDDDDQFYNVELTNSLSKITSDITEDDSNNEKKNASSGIYSMSAAGSTAVYQGLLRGFQILNNGQPENASDEDTEDYNEKVKILLIVTDGEESPDSGIFEKLISSGLCDQAREQISNLYIGVIGVDFDPSGDLETAYENCVKDDDSDDPEEHIYSAKNSSELVEYIEELIAKGASTSGVTTLY